jgi:hypothetical protein
MPINYEGIRMHIACSGMEHENTTDILRNKIRVLGGFNYISAENINKTNQNRVDNFNSFIESAYPYIKIKKEDKKTGIDSLVAQYREMFPDTPSTNSSQDENK